MQRFTSINSIDLAKTKLEAKYQTKIKAIFKNIANDVAKLYASNGNYKDVADNYYTDFVALIRNIMRDTCNTFLYSIRGEKKEITKEEEEQANNLFLISIVLFIANQSEKKVKYITDTNKVMIDYEVEQAELQSLLQASKIQEEINRTLDNKKREQLIKKKANVESKNSISNNIKSNLLDKAENRSNLIAEDIVGSSESFTREEEAKLVQNLNPEDVYVKEWVSVLDKRTRQDHVKADGQVVNLNESFIVGGERLLYPRDNNASISQTARCRCIHLIKKLDK
jgi:uncharacterized protein with gpF-like domain